MPPLNDRRRHRRWLLIAAAGLPLAPLRAQPTPALTLEALMAHLARRKSGQARFTEERSVSGIDGPLLSSGTLSFAAPDRFTRQTLTPTRESVELQGRTLTLRRGGRTRTMEMDALPELTALLDALRGTLTGDAALLNRHFRAALSGGEAKWVLSLTPREETLARAVRHIEIVGQVVSGGADMRSVELRLASGDRSLMLLEPLPEPPSGPSSGPSSGSPPETAGGAQK
jgi:hypothetical protein